jgi:DNA repair protein RadC
MPARCQRSLEILSALLDGPHPRSRARVLLARHGSLRRLVATARGASPELEPHVRERLLAALELSQRALEPPTAARLLSPASVVRACPALWHAAREEIWVIVVDAQLRVVRRRRIARGGQEHAATNAARVLRPVIACDAEKFFILHNHPSGEVSPSADDIAFTDRLAALARTLGVTMLDHLIVAGPHWHSCATGISGTWVEDATPHLREAS